MHRSGPGRRSRDGDRHALPDGLSLDGEATARDARELRVRFEQWLRDVGASATVAQDLALAVYEALANAAEHAYAGRDEAAAVHLAAERDDTDQVLVTVSDRGVWRPPSAAPGDRGRGLALVRELTTDAAVTSGPTGTTVRMCARLRR